MDCGICSREFSSRRLAVCAGCARARLYISRMRQASALLGRENQHAHAEAILRPGNDGVIASLPQDADYDAIGRGIKNHHLQTTHNERLLVEDRISAITEKADELRKQINDTRRWMAERKKVYAKRRSDVAAERDQLARHKARVFDPVATASRKAEQRTKRAHARVVEARQALCVATANLSGLQRRTGPGKRDEYWLGGVRIPDLRELNDNISGVALRARDAHDADLPIHEVVTTGLNNVCRLLSNCCHYLSVRLPAEIILPHDGEPHSAIMPDRTSYRIRPPRESSDGSIDRKSKPAGSTPRALILDRPLAKLLRDDHKKFTMFIEGIGLLAYNVAWLCKSQGVEDIRCFDDVCNMSRNLYELLLAKGTSKPRLDRKMSTAATRNDEPRTPTTVATRHLGNLSHSSSRYTLVSAEVNDMFQKWAIPSPGRLADRLRNLLLDGVTRAEWDVVNDKEWDEVDDTRTVLVAGARKHLDTEGAMMSIMSLRPSDGDPEPPTTVAKGWKVLRDQGEMS